MAGPSPKPDAERRRRNKEGRFVTPLEGDGAPPPVGRGGRRSWSPESRRWWKALLESRQRHSYEPSDWEIALRDAEVLVPMVMAGNLHALRELRADEDRILMSVKARQIARITLPAKSTPPPAADANAPTNIDAIRARASG